MASFLVNPYTGCVSKKVHNLAKFYPNLIEILNIFANSWSNMAHIMIKYVHKLANSSIKRYWKVILPNLIFVAINRAWEGA